MDGFILDPHPALTSLNGMLMNHVLLRPQAPLTPVVSSAPVRTGELGSTASPSGLVGANLKTWNP